ncbi:MAG: CoA transferase, partial [Dehalococcoidia bacterium]|nr:CoA transferase [Dehalococcoidia bacterium]
MADTALSHLKIVELGEFIAAPFCTKLMADLGAEVIKIESPGGGDSARSYGPFPGDIPHPEKSLLFAYLNTSKRGITLDVSHPSGRKVLLELLKEADVFVESNPPKVMGDLKLTYGVLSEVNPNLIVTSVSPFGQSGPYRDYKSTELVNFQMGGVGYATPGEVEDPDNHPPLKAPGHQGYVMAAYTAASATMCALFGRDLNGGGQHVDISQQEPLLSA